MNTIQDVINAFKELSSEQQEKVREIINSTDEDGTFLIEGFEAEYVQEENFSEEDQAILDQCQEEAERGENIFGPFEGEEANEFLRKIMKKE